MNRKSPQEPDLITFIESSYDGYWDWYIQEDYEYMSPRFWDMLGYDPKEKRHHPSEWQSIILEDSLKIALDNFEKHVQTKGKHPFHQEVKYRHKNGSIVYIMCRGKVIEWDEEENPIRMIGTHTDITVQKETENTLQLQKEYLELSDKVADVGHWRVDIEQQSIFWSDGIYQIHGVSKDEYKPDLDSAIDFYHPDDKEQVIAYVNKAIENQESFEFKLRLVRPNGDIRHVFSRGKIISSSGKPILFGIFQDITEQVQNMNMLEEALNKLRDAESFQNLINNSNPDLIFVKDQDFRIVQANKAFINVYPKEQQDKIIGYTTFEEYCKEEADGFLVQDKIAFKDGHSEIIETTRFPNGKTRTFFVKKTRFENEQKEPFILCIARDVTQRENLIAELKRSNEELDEFAYIASHDLKEPLRGIHNYASFLLEDYEEKLDQDGQDKLKTLKRLTQRMEKLLDELLHYARISRTDTKYQTVSLSNLVEEVQQMLSLTIEEQNVEIIIPKQLPSIQGEKILLNELFTNLITNAIKYNDKAEKQIEIGYIAKKNREDVLYVRDNGIGIDKKHHHAIFKIFKRLHPKNQYGGGTGFGLTMVQKIIAHHGGKIWLESEPNIGSTFYFTLTQEP